MTAEQAGQIPPDVTAAAAALKAAAPSPGEIHSMLVFLCGYCPHGVQSAIENMHKMRELKAEREARRNADA
jgi:hypothetical protein